MENTRLIEALALIKNTPIDEPEIYKIMDETPNKKSDAVKLAFTRSNLKIKDFTAIEIAQFYDALHKKITSTKNDDGIFKSTNATANYTLPNFEEVEEISEILVQLDINSKKQEALQKKIQSGAKVEKDEILASFEETKSIYEKLDEITFRVANIDKEKLTKWEQFLIAEQIFASVNEVQLTSMGKPSKKL